MEDHAVPGHPAVPGVAPGTLGRGRPYLITWRERHSVGWQVTRKDGPCFVVARTSGMGNEKVVDRFPLTEGGWAMAWSALVSLDPEAAQAAAQDLQRRRAANAALAGRTESQASAYETLARGGPVTKFREIGVQIPAGEEAVYTIGSDDPAAKTNSSRLLGRLAGARAMVPNLSVPAWMPMLLDGNAAVVCPDGTVHRTWLGSTRALLAAREQVGQFNALAGAAATSTCD